MPPPNQKHTMNNIVADPFTYADLTYNSANGILAAMFYRILGERKISLPAWGQLMNDFVSDARNGLKDDNQKDKTSMRGNLTKEFSRLAMTWKVFIKGLKILQVVRFRVHIEAQYATGKPVLHSSDWTTLRDVEAGNLDISDSTEELSREIDDPAMNPVKRAEQQYARDEYDRHVGRERVVDVNSDDQGRPPKTDSLYERR